MAATNRRILLIRRKKHNASTREPWSRARRCRRAVVGVALGIVGALPLTRLVSSLLFGVTPTDPFTFGAVVAVRTAVAGLAGYVPAAGIEPMSALRES